MSTRFTILGSGSAGNCALLDTGESRVLIDAGFSARRLEALLAGAGSSLAQIDAILLTHEHGDHSAALTGLAKFPRIAVFANHATARALQSGLKHRPAWQLFETGTRFRFRDLEIDTFSVPHDAHDPVGFVVSTGHEGDLFSPRRSLAWLTDLGHAPAHVVMRLAGLDYLVVESNHCPKMLEADARRPWSLKQRISGRHGHLSNTAAHALLAAVERPRWRHVFLAHLSRDCNSIETVRATFTGLFAGLGCGFSIVDPEHGSPTLEFAAS